MLSYTRRILSAASLVGLAFAQDARSTSVTQAVSPSLTATTSYSTVTIFAPTALPSGLSVSVISAAPDLTTYAVRIGDSTTVTLTEGPSTAMLTVTTPGAGNGGLTLECALTGAGTDGIGATNVVCAGSTSLDGLGGVATTSTLRSDQISYVPVTITAGEAALKAAATMTGASGGGETSQASGAASPRRTGLARPVGLVAAVGVVGLRLL